MTRIFPECGNTHKLLSTSWVGGSMRQYELRPNNGGVVNRYLSKMNLGKYVNK